MNWIEALKKWNSGRPKWMMPKKGTPEHAEVMAMVTPKKSDHNEKEAEKGKKDSKHKEEEKKMETPRKVKIYNPADDFDHLDKVMESMRKKKEEKGKKDSKHKEAL